MKQRIIISSNLKAELAEAIEFCRHDRVFVLVDTVTERLCLPLLTALNIPQVNTATVITIGATDSHKDLSSLEHVWTELQRGGATRHSCLINLGGGMVTDLGGFAASTFKRGINFINIPTTLLAMVDASVGGKTGVNFGGLKNEIGVFSDAHTVIICADFLRTLDSENLCSGYAEMLKHGLISTPAMWSELVGFDILHPDLAALQRMVADSIGVKERVVEQDPHERGLRKALNLGHTVGHAFEALALHRNQPLLHGYAVAYGLVCELYLSCVITGFPTDIMRQAVTYIKEVYGNFAFTCDDYDTLVALMKHDKKNTAGTINFTLLGGIGDIRINQTATHDTLLQALDFLRDGL